MKVLYTTKNNRLTVEIEADTQTELFRELAAFQEVFEDLTCVRKVGDKVLKSDNVKFQVRMAKDDKGEENEYFELVCLDDNPDLKYTKKAFGQHKKGGGLFPKRKDKDGNWLPGINGWVKYEKPNGQETATKNESTAEVPF